MKPAAVRGVVDAEYHFNAPPKLRMRTLFSVRIVMRDEWGGKWTSRQSLITPFLGALTYRPRVRGLQPADNFRLKGVFCERTPAEANFF